MSKGKAPADQWYWGDWLRDVELQAASACARGVWANILGRMWFAKTKGEIVGIREILAKLSISTTEEFDIFLEEAKALGFCYVLQDTNGIITIRNRRMFNKEKEQESNRLRQKRYYEKHKPNGKINEKLTSPSSSSPSSSTTEQELLLPDFIDPETWKAFKTHRVQIKRRMTLHAEKLIINKLIKFKEAGHDPNAIINLSIENGWISVFEPKREIGASTTPSKSFDTSQYGEPDPEKTAANLKKVRETLGGIGDKGIG